MASTSGLDEDQQSSPLVSAPDRGSGLEGAQHLTTSSDSSDLAQNHFSAPFPPSDLKTGIQGERNRCKAS